MQRNSFYKTNIKYISIFLLLVIYESLTSIYLFLTPLFGVVFYYMLKHIYDEKYLFRVVLAFLYILIFEIDKGFIPLSFILFFAIYYYFVQYKIEKFFTNEIYTKFFHIFNAYIGYYMLNLILAYLFNYELPIINIKYILYIFVDFLISVVVL